MVSDLVDDSFLQGLLGNYFPISADSPVRIHFEVMLGQHSEKFMPKLPAIKRPWGLAINTLDVISKRFRERVKQGSRLRIGMIHLIGNIFDSASSHGANCIPDFFGGSSFGLRVPCQDGFS